MRYDSQVRTFANILQKHYPNKTIHRMLDFGCGCGLETFTLQRITNIPTFGIDVNTDFDVDTSKVVELRHYDGAVIPYPNAHFDGVYSFHVLEHVENMDQVLSEVTRVIKPGGFGYFGVPNKSRLFAYFGIPGKSFFRNVRKNFRDLKYRIMGRFSNEHGAHAGFRESVFVDILAKYFSKVIPVTDEYYFVKWKKYQKFQRWLWHTRLGNIIWPSVYVLCIR